MCSRFAADVKRLGRFRLHPVGQLERLDAGFELGLMAVPLEVLAIELGQEVELGPLRPGAHTVVADVRDQLFDLGVPAVQVGSLVDPRQEGRLPVLRLGDGVAVGAHDEKAGQVLVLGAQSVKHPRSQAGPGLARSPQFISMSEGSWLGTSACIERITQISSIISAVWEKISLTSMPL